MNIINSVKLLEWHPVRRWSTRDLNTINKIIIHQELGESTIEAVNQYHIHPNHISSRGCPHFCYHYGIERSGEIILANELNQIVWHTLGQNQTSIGIMLVGNFAGTGNHTGTRKPTENQMKALKWLVDYLINAFSFSNQVLYGHYHFGKPACPGTIIQDWIEKRREIINEIQIYPFIKKTVKEIQIRLNKLGYNCGNADGIIGVKTLAAIRSFQRDQGLNVDGIVGPETWKHLLLNTLEISNK